MACRVGNGGRARLRGDCVFGRLGEGVQTNRWQVAHEARGIVPSPGVIAGATLEADIEYRYQAVARRSNDWAVLPGVGKLTRDGGV